MTIKDILKDTEVSAEKVEELQSFINKAIEGRVAREKKNSEKVVESNKTLETQIKELQSQFKIDKESSNKTLYGDNYEKVKPFLDKGMSHDDIKSLAGDLTGSTEITLGNTDPTLKPKEKEIIKVNLDKVDLNTPMTDEEANAIADAAEERTKNPNISSPSKMTKEDLIQLLNS